MSSVEIPVRIQVGDGDLHEIGTVADPRYVPALLRESADYIQECNENPLAGALNAPQPAPTRGTGTSVQWMVRQDLAERERQGVQKYGTSLHAHNGRDALIDAYQEALDLACYLRQAIEERSTS